ncbi:hypothetical protein MTY414_75830 [Mycolicibacterium mageritense]|nr:hypothetical protein MTY414_75830 [Mycolicibacterium mageritense]
MGSTAPPEVSAGSGGKATVAAHASRMSALMSASFGGDNATRRVNSLNTPAVSNTGGLDAPYYRARRGRTIASKPDA